MMTGIGTPSNQSKIPRPMIVSSCRRFSIKRPEGQFVPENSPVEQAIASGAGRTKALRKRAFSNARRLGRAWADCQPLLRKPAETPLIVS